MSNEFIDLLGIWEGRVKGRKDVMRIRSRCRSKSEFFDEWFKWRIGKVGKW